jgi:hypothetical protein
LDLSKGSNTDSEIKAKELENYRAKKNRIRELLKFIEEELKD